MNRLDNGVHLGQHVRNSFQLLCDPIVTIRSFKFRGEQKWGRRAAFIGAAEEGGWSPLRNKNLKVSFLLNTESMVSSWRLKESYL